MWIAQWPQDCFFCLGEQLRLLVWWCVQKALHLFWLVASCEAAPFIQTGKNVQALASMIWNRGSWREQPVTDEIRRLI